MISSTRSSESAFMSSWKEASSRTSPGSTPSCSTRIVRMSSVTFSRSTKLPFARPLPCTRAEVGGQPNNWVRTPRDSPERRLSYRRAAAADPGLELRHQALADPASGHPEGVGDAPSCGAAVADDGEPPHPEQVGAAVLVGVDALGQAAQRGP